MRHREEGDISPCSRLAVIWISVALSLEKRGYRRAVDQASVHGWAEIFHGL